MTMAANTKRKAAWKKRNPKASRGASRKLTTSQKAAAKARAKKSGRRYPNLVDNMTVAKKATVKRAAAKKATGKRG